MHMLYLYDCQVIQRAGSVHISCPCPHLLSKHFSVAFGLLPDIDSAVSQNGSKALPCHRLSACARARNYTPFTDRCQLIIRLVDFQEHSYLTFAWIALEHFLLAHSMAHYVQHSANRPVVGPSSHSQIGASMRSRARSTEEKDHAALQAQLRAAANRREVLRDARRLADECDEPAQQQLTRHSSMSHSAAASSSQHRPSFAPKEKSPNVRFSSSESDTRKRNHDSSKSRDHKSSKHETSRGQSRLPAVSNHHSTGWTSKFSSMSSQKDSPITIETTTATWVNTNPSYCFPSLHPQHETTPHDPLRHPRGQRKDAGFRTEDALNPVGTSSTRAATSIDSKKTHPNSMSSSHNQSSPLRQPQAVPDNFSHPAPTQRTDIYLGVGPSSWFMVHGHGAVILPPQHYTAVPQAHSPPHGAMPVPPIAQPAATDVGYMTVDPALKRSEKTGPKLADQNGSHGAQPQHRQKIRQPVWDDKLQSVRWEFR